MLILGSKIWNHICSLVRARVRDQPLEDLVELIKRRDAKEVLRRGGRDPRLELLGIDVLDHVVVGADRYFSFAEHATAAYEPRPCARTAPLS